jgi:hypothetical protein
MNFPNENSVRYIFVNSGWLLHMYMHMYTATVAVSPWVQTMYVGK